VKSDIYYCNSEAMQKPVDMYSPDVIRTYKAVVSHWPEFSAEELAVKPFNGIQPFFLTPKLKLKSSDSVWFLKTPVEKNTLSKICKELIEGAGIEAKGRMFSNKIPRRIGISRMEATHVPIEKGMRITGHRYFYLFRDHKSYAKYSALDSDID
jgi:hypothetical protein